MLIISGATRLGKFSDCAAPRDFYRRTLAISIATVISIAAPLRFLSQTAISIADPSRFLSQTAMFIAAPLRFLSQNVISMFPCGIGS